MQLGVLSVDCGEEARATTTGGDVGDGSLATEESPSQESRQLKARVEELEEELAMIRAESGRQRSPGGDTVEQLQEKVERLQAALSQNDSTRAERQGDEAETVRRLREKVAELQEALAESRTPVREGGAAGDGDQIRRLQERLAELEGQLRKSVPRSELEEVQVTLGVQCEQLARERADVARKLNDALLDLERLRPPSPGGAEEEDEEEEERSVSSEPSVTSGGQSRQHLKSPCSEIFVLASGRDVSQGRLNFK